MCDNCNDIVLRDHFYSSRDYLNCLNYIHSIVAQEKYEIINQTCPLDKVKSADGSWASDIITHDIKSEICAMISFTNIKNIYQFNRSIISIDNRNAKTKGVKKKFVLIGGIPVE